MMPNIPQNLEGLVGLARHDGVDIRPTLLRVLTDLYVQKPVHTPEEEKHYVELAQRLFASVDATTKATVTARLMAYGNVPDALAHHLEIRTILPEVQAPQIVETPAATARATERRAQELTEIFFAADAAERRAILLNLDAVAVKDVAPINKANEVIRHLESAALRHDAGAFAREVVGKLNIAREVADRMVEDESGEPLLVIARMFDMPQTTLQRVLLFLNPTVGQSVQRVYELASLYGEITRPAAAHLLSIFRLGTALDRPAYQSVLYDTTVWNDETLSAREAATPREHKAPPTQPDADADESKPGLAKISFG